MKENFARKSRRFVMFRRRKKSYTNKITENKIKMLLLCCFSNFSFLFIVFSSVIFPLIKKIQKKEFEILFLIFFTSGLRMMIVGY